MSTSWVLARVLAAAALLPHTTTAMPSGGTQDTVCIIGAGASGLAANLRLKSKGYNNVVVFERERIAGGKALTHTGPDGNKYYMGAGLGTNSTYPSLRSLLDQYQVPTYPSTNVPAYIFDAHTGAIVNVTTDTTEARDPAVASAFRTYMDLRDNYKEFLVPGFIRGVPDDLAQPFEAWLEMNGLQALYPDLWYSLTTFGYGPLKDLPAIYGLYYIDESDATQEPMWFTDFADLWNRVANATADVRYNTRQLKVSERIDGSVSITYTIEGDNSTQVQNCAKLIVAIAPSLSSLQDFDLDEQETKVFSRVVLKNYDAWFVHLPNSSYGIFANLLQPTVAANTTAFAVSPEGITSHLRATTASKDTAPQVRLGEPASRGEPVLYSQDGAGREYVAAWTLAEDGSPPPTDNLRQSLLKAMSKLNRPADASVDQATPLKSEDVTLVRRWEYFAHFDSAYVRDGLKELEALQGHRSTYWLSSLRYFEDQEAVVLSAFDIVDRLF